MTDNDRLKNQKAFGLIGLVLAAAIIAFFMWIMMGRYVGRGPGANTDSGQMPEELKQYGVDTSSRTAVLQSITRQIKDIEQRQLNRPQELMRMNSDKIK